MTHSKRAACVVLFTVAGGAVLAMLAMGCGNDFDVNAVISPDRPENEPPEITVREPAADLAVSQGDQFIARWTDSDPDDNALIDIDLLQTNGSLTFRVAGGIRENGPSSQDVFTVDTSGVTLGNYFVRMTINDGVNNPVTSFAADPATGIQSIVTITEQGLGQSNTPPRVAIIDPQVNIGVSQSDLLSISIRPTPGPVPLADPGPAGHYDQDGDAVDVTIVLDLDEDPQNDDFTTEMDPGNIILDRFVIAGGRFDEITSDITIDVQEVPVRRDGKPYFIRVTASDGLNVRHEYASATVHVLELVEGSRGTLAQAIDLRDIGNTLAGAVFVGFNPLSNLGTKMASALDIDADGTQDVVVIAQYGNPRNLGNIGEAYLLFGTAGRRFGGRININSLASDASPSSQRRVRGTVMTPTVDRISGGLVDLGRGDGRRIGFSSLEQPYTLGITDVVAINDLGGDGTAADAFNLPELIFGLPHNEYMGSTSDNDPADDPGGDTGFEQYCYPDNLSNNYASDVDPDPTQNLRYAETTWAGLGVFGIEERMGTAAMIYGENFIAGVDDTLGPLAPRTDVYDLGACGSQYAGCRFNVAIYDNYGVNNPAAPFPINPLNSHQGFNVAVLPDIDLNTLDEVIVSSPRNELEVQQLQADFGESHSHLASRLSRGNVTVYLGQDFQNCPAEQDTRHVPFIVSGRGCCSCNAPPNRVLATNLSVRDSFARGATHPEAFKNVITTGGWFRLTGEKPTDKLGFARSAGDFNQDGPADILCGAPFADPTLDLNNNGIADEDPVQDAGTVYVVYNRFPFGNVNLNDANNAFDLPPNVGGRELRPPMLRIFGESPLDHLGIRQESGSDINGDGIDDVVIASKEFNGRGLVDNGAIAIVYGGQRIDGDRMFSEIATPRLTGTIFFGTSAADFAGTDIAAGGDFNSDGLGDLIISAPGELRSVTGEDKPRRGVVYVIFGGQHLVDRVFTLNQVGTSTLPGIVLLGPYQAGTLDTQELDRPIFVRSQTCEPFDSNGNVIETECLCDPEVEEQCELLEVGGNGPPRLVMINDAAPERVGFIGDINGDGFEDIMIGNPTADFNDPQLPAGARRRDTGEVYLIYGNNLGANSLIAGPTVGGF